MSSNHLVISSLSHILGASNFGDPDQEWTTNWYAQTRS